eukprot:CAMPEP_0169416940 /NCGR_PEP_ID=MMETSP1017-20121227/63416_1 /TAXON_ID=342587 /ORGANISM="Karlodinium micrum, Strain CCMP2283" /LENGTH=62 /DNA_ID=CAMNT_0009524973 /DNA_START=34 /DNA_END=219 /DNA_ORIENTATION=-
MTGSHAQVNAMTPGSEVNCIIGKAQIKDFNLVTEVLQREVMTFVNQVAEIIHGVGQEYSGAP